jgi:hypothetical protein
MDRHQLSQASGWEQTPRYLIRDRDFAPVCIAAVVSCWL